jgi:predicted nucleic-acid-binding protein
MLAVDTNVLVRLLVRDDPHQVKRAEEVVRDNEIWVSKTVLLETGWVLGSAYGFRAQSIAEAMRKLAGLPNIVIEDSELVSKALEWFEHGLDLADALHLASAVGVDEFVTFDRKLVARANEIGDVTTVAL